MRKSGNTGVKKIEDESRMFNIRIVRVPKRANRENRESRNSARKFPRAKGCNFPN